MNDFVIGVQRIQPLKAAEAAVPATVKTHGTVQPWPLTLGPPHTQRRVLGVQRRAGTHTVPCKDRHNKVEAVFFFYSSPLQEQTKHWLQPKKPIKLSPKSEAVDNRLTCADPP